MKLKGNEAKGGGKVQVHQKYPKSVKVRNSTEYVRVNAEYLEVDLKQM
jgi:hypothetical protein